MSCFPAKINSFGKKFKGKIKNRYSEKQSYFFFIKVSTPTLMYLNFKSLTLNLNKFDKLVWTRLPNTFYTRDKTTKQGIKGNPRVLNWYYIAPYHHEKIVISVYRRITFLTNINEGEGGIMGVGVAQRKPSPHQQLNRQTLIVEIADISTLMANFIFHYEFRWWKAILN